MSKKKKIRKNKSKNSIPRKSINKSSNTYCNLCNNGTMLETNGIVEEHLVVTLSDIQHTHYHGPTTKQAAKTLIDCAIDRSKLREVFEKEFASMTGVSNSNSLPKQIIFKNKQRLGDSLMMTCSIRDFSKAFPDIRINVISTAPRVWDNNPHIDRTVSGIEPTPIGPKTGTNTSNTSGLHFANAYRISMERTLGVSIPQGLIKPDIWLSKEEFDAKPVIDKPYWIVCIGGEKGWPVKMYPFEYWQEFVSQNKDIYFCQIGTKEDNHPRLQGDNVIDYIGKTQSKETGIRDLFKLFLNSQGSIGLVSFHMHLSAAFDKPCIVIAGAREPVSFTRYHGHQYLSTEGTMKCSAGDRNICWACKLDGCVDKIRKEDINEGNEYPRCVDHIKPSDLTNSLRKYYEGGRLHVDKRLSKYRKVRKFNKITDMPVCNVSTKSIIHSQPKIIDKEKIARENRVSEVTTDNRWGIDFGGDSITDKDWAFIKDTLDKYNIDTVLEFGTGLLTLLLNDHGNKVLTFDVDRESIGVIKQIGGSLCDNVYPWSGKTIVTNNTNIMHKFDLVFVDNPPGGSNREYSIKIASESSDMVIVHDAGREWEQKWQDKYLKPSFDMVEKGGNRCHFWIRKGTKKIVSLKTVSVEQGYRPKTDVCSGDIVPPKGGTALIKKRENVKGLVRIAFNGRGEGGAERSITWIANELYDRGYDVVYHSPLTSNNSPIPCKTFMKEGNKNIQVEGVETMNRECDIFFLYCNDWIWEFSKFNVQVLFNNLQASRKVMNVNYRLGSVGNPKWTKDWDKYLFLNGTLMEDFLKRIPDAETLVLAPPVDLSLFLENKPDYNNGIHLIRHSSQGNSKYRGDVRNITDKILSIRKDLDIKLMPAPDKGKYCDKSLSPSDRVETFKRNNPPIPDFLKMGNCFFYMLPEGFYEGGPRVIMEAQASGLPVITDNHSGMVDRVPESVGWRCDKLADYYDIISTLTPEILREKGEASREHAVIEYDRERWIKEIIG